MMDDLLQEMIDPAPVHHDAPRRRRLWTHRGDRRPRGRRRHDADHVGHLHRQRRDVGRPSRAAPSTWRSARTCRSPSRRRTWHPATRRSSRCRSTTTARSRCGTRSRTRAAGARTALPTRSSTRRRRPATCATVLELNVYARRPRRAARRPASTGATPLNAGHGRHRGPATSTPARRRHRRRVADAATATSPWTTPSEWLCFRVDFPERRPATTYQDAGVTLDLTFNAEQTANNP